MTPADDWTATPAADVRLGDRFRLGSGTELTVTGIKTSFLGLEDLVCFVEDSETQWLAQALWLTSEVEVKRAPAELRAAR